MTDIEQKITFKDFCIKNNLSFYAIRYFLRKNFGALGGCFYLKRKKGGMGKPFVVINEDDFLLYIQKNFIPSGRDFLNYYHISPKELEILKVFASGVTEYKDIGEKLKIKTSTVKTHISSIFQKLLVNNKVNMLIQAIKKGLVEIEREKENEKI